MIRGTGWRKDDVIVPGALEHDRYGSAKPLPRKNVELAQFVGGSTASALPVLDQGQTSRCVSFSGAEVVWARTAKLRRPRRFINIPAAYVAAQRWEQNRRKRRAPLADIGLHPTDFVSALSAWGVGTLSGPNDPAMREDLVLEDVDVAEYQRAATHRITDWHRVDDSLKPDDAVEDAKRYIDAGFPGMAGLDLDEKFMTYAGGIYERDPRAKSIGGHMISAHGFDDDLQALLCLNHYSPEWGVRGFFWLSYRTFGTTALCTDRYFVDAGSIE